MFYGRNLVAQTVKNPRPTETGKPGFDPWLGKIPWRRAWQSTPILLPGESPWAEEPGGLHSPWSRKELDTTEQLSTAYSPYCYERKKESEVTQSRLFVNPWAAAYQAPSSMGFSRQEY